MLSKYGNHTHLLKIKNKLKIGCFYKIIKSGWILNIFWAILIKQLFLAVVGYATIIAILVLRTLLAIYHLISNVHSWNNYYMEL